MGNFNILVLELAHNELHVFEASSEITSFKVVKMFISQMSEHVHHSKRIHTDIP